MSAVGVGIIGSGFISDTYLENLGSFPDVEVVVLGDLDVDRARAKAHAHGVPSWGTPDDVLASPDVQVVVNLTTPAAHAGVSMAAIQAGKHVWTEKPIGLDLNEASRLLDAAKAADVRIGAAPDTVLGPGFQAAKRAIASGLIGTPLFAETTFQTQGPDLWHPAPQFLFARGAGPLLDMGPYYFTGLVSLLGPVARVAALGMRPRSRRTVRSGPDAGGVFDVEVPTTFHVLAAFDGGAQAHTLVSFDSALERHGVFEIHGSEGSLVLPDPNTFGGRTSYVRPLAPSDLGSPGTQQLVDLEHEGVVVGRGLGVLEMVRAIAAGRPHIASGELARHVLEVMVAAEESARSGSFADVDTSIDLPPAVDLDFDPFARTL